MIQLTPLCAKLNLRSKMEILIVEDNEIYRNKLRADLISLGHHVEVVLEFNELDNYRFKQFDLIILDITLPSINGLDLIQVIKSCSYARIFMLTSDESQKTEYNATLNGADDYITKPHYLPLLDYKIKQLTEEANIIYKEHTIDLSTMKIDNQIKLTKQEYQILIHLLNNRNKACSKNQLLELLWENNFFVEIDALYSLIYRLRKKLLATEITIENRKGSYWIND